MKKSRRNRRGKKQKKHEKCRKGEIKHKITNVEKKQIRKRKIKVKK